MKKIIGFILLGVTVLTWGIAVALPFLGLTVAQLAIATTATVIVGEGAFWFSMILLGSQYWARIKSLVINKLTPFKRVSSTPA